MIHEKKSAVNNNLKELRHGPCFLTKKSLNFSISSFVIHVNLRQP